MSLPSLYLDAFYACALVGHFTKASEKLFISQSALSQRISKLEDELGTSLFIRLSSGIKLTAAGEELLRYCKTKEALEFQSLERIKGESLNELTGVIRIGGFSSVMRSVILPILADILRENPKVKLKIITEQIDNLPSLFKRGEIDYLIYYNEISHDHIETTLIGEEKNFLAEKKGYKGPEVYLDHDENDQTTAKYLKKIKSKSTYERKYLDDVYGLIDGVKQGLGKAVIPKHLIKNDKSIKILDTKNFISFPVRLHYFKQPYYSKLHIKLVKQLIKKTPNFLK